MKQKCIALILALMLCLGAFALAEEADPDARIAELEAEVERLTTELEEARAVIRDYEEQAYVVTFDGGVVTLEEAQTQYNYITSMYESYGYSISGQEDFIREQLLQMMAQSAVVKAEATDRGFRDLDEEAMAAYESEATIAYESYITSYISYFAAEGTTEEEARAATEEYLNGAGYSYEDILESMISTHAEEALYDEVVKDVTVTEEEILAEYDEQVAADSENYAEGGYGFESRMSGASTVYWYPEGYRQVKHVLIKFDDDQSALYSDLSSLADDLEAQIAAANESDGEETAEEEDEETEPVDVEALKTQLAETLEQLDALYAELLPKAEEVISKFEAGEDFDSLIDAYGEDPGMTTEPGKTQGYVVSENSVIWDPAFTAGAMSIENVGEISEPVYGSYGIHIIYYMQDLPAGAVPYEDVHDTLEESVLLSKQNEVYNEAVEGWMEARNVEYHLDRFK